MKVERTQTQLPKVSRGQTEAVLTVERRLTLPSLLEACRFIARIADRMTAKRPDAPQTSSFEIEFRHRPVVLSVVATGPRFLGTEPQLIDTLSGRTKLVEETPRRGVSTHSGASGE